MRVVGRFLLVGCLACLLSGGAHAEPYRDRLRGMLAAQIVPHDEWRFSRPAVKGAEAPGFDDSAWRRVDARHRWQGRYAQAWFRARIVVPAEVGGFTTRGRALRIQIGVDDTGYVYVDGALRRQFTDDNGDVPIASSVTPGSAFVIAMRNRSGLDTGQIHYSRLVFALPGPLQVSLERLTAEVAFYERLRQQVAGAERDRITEALHASEAAFDPGELHRGYAAFARTVAEARRPFGPLAALARRYTVSYIGHSHVDMNWLWDWPTTIDICRRTWDSTTALLRDYPDFRFAQSQPGAYLAIEQRYPALFGRMRGAVDRGQWNVVGGFWVESDTNLPSGEALVRSLVLGQRYFHSRFGRYARTGWLPDSFGHSRQVPQLLRGVGIDAFYHTRCADGVPFAWWASPDGSRVLKAATDGYEQQVSYDQTLEALENERRGGLRQALVVFGVGDHGGGTTRDRIDAARCIQQDPLLPRIRLSSADGFFDRLRSEPASRRLPVIGRDLQYFAPGCYTTHADMKREVRACENALYSAEAFGALAAMRGRAYPAGGFESAWKPVAFAQSHDMLCGSAIHSTYTWMKAQLAPVRAYAGRQQDAAVRALTRAADTRGARDGERAVVVWNALSFARDDVVRVRVPDAARYRSVRDAAGRREPVQPGPDGSLVFIARGVPPFGCAVRFLSRVPCAAAPAVRVAVEPDRYVVQNAFVRVAIDRRTGVLANLRDLGGGRELLNPEGASLELLGDTGDAWKIALTGDRTPLRKPDAAVTLLADGPVFATVRVRRAAGASTFTQDTTVYAGLRRVEVPLHVSWHEHGVMLKAAFPLDMAHPSARVGVPYGSADRPTNGQENPAQKWMDVTERVSEAPGSRALFGLTVLNAAACGSDTTGSVFRLSLLRSPGDPDPLSDEGEQRFTIALLPHAGDWRTGMAERAGLGLSMPLRAELARSHAGQAGSAGIRIAVVRGGGDLVAGALKHCDTGPGVILRIFETHGRNTVARITFPARVRVVETDLLERPVRRRRIDVRGCSVELPVGHDQIVTLRVNGLLDAGRPGRQRRAPRSRAGRVVRVGYTGCSLCKRNDC